MKYSVTITPDAENDLRTAYRYIRKHAPKAAAAWIKGARSTIKSLAQYPERGHLAPESSSFQEPIREVLYGSGNRGTYRILFVVLDKAVFVLHVRHGAMLPLDPKE
ncbi:MAG: type II toxin-antitoxin system RelE/ParE family toxin [Hyphomicrobiales bacterium]|nr:type II toxin-antitoxin system RelE/ParE family toxin [Hyphomicrobiales bacterium]